VFLALSHDADLMMLTFFHDAEHCLMVLYLPHYAGFFIITCFRNDISTNQALHDITLHQSDVIHMTSSLHQSTVTITSPSMLRKPPGFVGVRPRWAKGIMPLACEFQLTH
jgi:hypothetical protein